MLSHAGILCAAEIDWLVHDCSGRYSYDFGTADVHEVPPTHFGARIFLGSVPRAPEGVKVSNPIDIKAMLDAVEEKVRERLSEALISPADKVSLVVLPNTEEVSPVVESIADGRKQRNFVTLLPIVQPVEKVTL